MYILIKVDDLELWLGDCDAIAKSKEFGIDYEHLEVYFCD